MRPARSLCIVLAAVLGFSAFAGLASAQSGVTLVPDQSSYLVGATVTITVHMSASAAEVWGGQFFLNYDSSKLSFIDNLNGDPPFDCCSVSPDPPTMVCPDPPCPRLTMNLGGGGTVSVAVVVRAGDPHGVTAATDMVRVRFTAIASIASSSGLVSFDTGHSPPNRLADDDGGNLLTSTTDLPPLTLTDFSGASATPTYADKAYAGLPSGTVVTFPYSPGTPGPHAIGVDAFSTIQAAVSANGATGGTVNVAAGTYPELVTVSTSLSILGPNAAVCGNGSRSPEAFVIPPSNTAAGDGSGASVFVITAGGVSIKGFTIDGHNPSVAGGLTLSGTATTAHADSAVRGWGEFDSTDIENNIIEDVAFVGVDFGSYNAAGIGPYSDGGPAATVNVNNTISCNLFQNIGAVDDAGAAVRIRNNFYAAVSGNVISNARVGIETGNFSLANTGAAPSIDHNTIQARRRGIVYNHHSGSASVIPVSLNGITALPNPFPGDYLWTGVYIISQQGTVTATFTNNSVDGSGSNIPATAGYTVLNTAATTTTTITGGTLSRVSYGVWLTNGDPNGFGASATADMKLTISGVAIHPTFSGFGVWVDDGGTNAFKTYAVVRDGNDIRGTTIGVYVFGVNGRATVINNSAALGGAITGNGEGVYVQDGRMLVENNDLRGNLFAGLFAFTGGRMDAGDCSGSNFSGLGTGTGPAGSSAGGNDLSGYVFDNGAPFAVDDENSSAQPNVYAQNNNYGAGPTDNIASLVLDTADAPVGSRSRVLYTQSGGQGITASVLSNHYCNFPPLPTSVTFTAVHAGPGTVHWYDGGDCMTPGTEIGTGDVLVWGSPPTSPGVHTYYARLESDGCTDDCASTTITVDAAPLITANVDLDSIAAGMFDHCITFVFYTTSGPCAAAYTHTETMSFSAGSASAMFTIPCGAYTGATARDTFHTLRRSADTVASFVPSGNDYTLNFTNGAGKALRSGNLNDDAFIDILDFGGFVSRINHVYGTGVDTPCGYVVPGGDIPTRHADFNGNAIADAVADYSFISTQFLAQREADPCGTPLADGQPVTDISVLDLAAIDYEAARTADFNRDGHVNAADIAYFGQHGFPACAGDFNDDGHVTVQDIFTYLSNWFAGYPGADINDDHHVSVQDIFDFVVSWFQGCP